MKKVVLSLFFISIIYPLSAQLDRSAMEKERIKSNRVSECIQFTHKYQNGIPDKQGYKTTHTHYNADGNPTLVINYRANGKESSRLSYKYDQKGRRIEYKKEEALGTNRLKVSYLQTFTYDSRGNKKREEGFDGSSKYRIVYSYLPNGKPSDITRYNADNSVSERWIYSYRGNVQTIRITPKNGQAYTLEKTYNNQNLLTRERYIDQANNVFKQNNYTYDARGRLIEEEALVNGSHHHTFQYQFNNQDQLLKVLCKQPSSKEFVNNNYTYDNAGNLITEQWVDGAPNLMSQKDNEFNHVGDMIKVQSFYAPYNYRVMYSYQYKKR